jgi:hypothetical protein
MKARTGFLLGIGVAGVAMLAVLAIGRFAARDDATGMQPPPAKPAAVAPQLTSAIPALQWQPLEALPAPPAAPALGDVCRQFAIVPNTPTGRVVRRRGWQVTGEATLGGYMIIAAFAHASDDGKTCRIEDGRVFVLRDQAPVAVLRAVDDPSGSGGLGYVAPTATLERLRLLPGVTGAPLADLVATPAGLAVAVLPDPEPQCGGAVQLPVVFGKSIGELRTRLAPFGWDADTPGPAEAAADPKYDGAVGLRAAGWTEAHLCFGPGVESCELGYHHASGALLTVTTAGDPPRVLTATVACPG